ncbi:MAG: GDYXXLXY domain-containing protein [Pseudomonadota bacterium]
MNKATAILMGGLVLALLVVNYAILKKEEHLENGTPVFLELVPVDPRSLMQGDYMALRFKLANDIRAALDMANVDESAIPPFGSDGHVVVNLTPSSVGSFHAVYIDQTLNDEQVLMQYRIRDDRVKFATNAFFFQEGHAKFYENARFGLFKVDSHGELLLASLHDENLNNLAPISDHTNKGEQHD